jgi:tetratricopeptide (TPR) repeat protein
MYANKGDYKQSIEFHQKALSINPQSYRGWYQLGLVQQANSQFPEALASYQKAIDNNPKMTDAYIGMGGAYYWSGNMKAALEQVEALKKMGAADQAAQLETWINNKEAKKNQGQQKSEDAAKKPEAAAAPAPAAEPAKTAAKPAAK